MENKKYEIIESVLNSDVVLLKHNDNTFSVSTLKDNEIITSEHFNDFMEANLRYDNFRDESDTTEEYCSTCGANAQIKYKFKIQRCNECGELIYPCNLCEQDFVNCFGECPLNQIKKYELQTYNDKFEVLASEVEEHFETDIETFLLEYTYDDAEYLADILKIKIERQEEYSI